ncbi:MAG: hypothetical protein ACODAU_06260 [Myxococcota bacterium]
MSTAPTESAPSPDGTRRALRHLAWVIGTCVLLAGATYLTPGLDRFRPWMPGDAPPLARLFEKWGTVEVPTFAGAGGGYQAPRQVSERAEKDLGTAVAQNLGEPREEPADPAPARRAEGRPPGVRIEPQEYAGIEVGIEDPGHRGMEPFYRALLRTARDEAGALSRIAHYGDSSIATDLITHTVRRRLQKRFGDGGHGFLLVARGQMPWGHRDVSHLASNEAWELRELVRSSLRSGRYGYGGVQYRGVPGAWARFGVDEEAPVGRRVSRFEVYYQRGRMGGKVRLQVDGETVRTLDTRGEETADAFEEVDVSDGAHELGLRVVAGMPVLYGVTMERDGPGVVYDSLGMVGARARRLMNYDRAHIARQIRHRGVHLLVLGFGGNEADDPPGRMKGYEDEFVKVIRHMRGGRKDLACLVFAPLDQARRSERGGVRTIPTVPKIVEAQKRAARREGCAFYNTFEAMGGEGAMQRWYRSRPRLALGDFRHATPAGYEAIGNMFYKAILQDFARWLRR